MELPVITLPLFVIGMVVVPAAMFPIVDGVCIAVDATRRALNFSTRKVGGLRFVKIGRITVSFCVSKRYRPL